MTTQVPATEPDLDAPIPTRNALDSQLLRLIAGGRGQADGSTGRAIREREQQYRDFLEALGVAVYTTDADGRITFYNAAAAALWGRQPELGEEWCGSLRLFRPDGEPLPHDQCPMAIALLENRAVRGEEAILERPDGTRAWFVPYPTPLRDGRGRLAGAVNVMVDVTERRHAEGELLKTAAALATSNAVKDEFLGLVSHELRTPVTTIFGNARLLHDRGEDLSPELRAGMVADILEDADRLQALIENLLQLTRLGSGTMPDLEPQVVDRIARRAIDAFGRRRPGRTVTLTGRADTAIVEADATWLELVIDNLLTNADKYSPPDRPIEVTIAERSDGVEVTVVDEGIGFEPDVAEQLFHPFYRSPRAKARAGGIGIGLTVCRRIVETLGGRIWARARPGAGAVFGFSLPIADEDGAA